MAFSRKHLLAQWGTNGATKRAFPVRVDGYRAPTILPKQVGRNLSGALLQAHGTGKKAMSGSLILDEGQSGQTVTYDGASYGMGQAPDLLAMYSAGDLQVKLFGDAAFWDAAMVGDYDPVLFTYTGSLLIAPVQMVEK